MTEDLTNRQGVPDGRTLDHDTLEQIRLRAFASVEAGESVSAVAIHGSALDAQRFGSVAAVEVAT